MDTLGAFRRGKHHLIGGKRDQLAAKTRQRIIEGIQTAPAQAAMTRASGNGKEVRPRGRRHDVRR